VDPGRLRGPLFLHSWSLRDNRPVLYHPRSTPLPPQQLRPRSARTHLHPQQQI